MHCKDTPFFRPFYIWAPKGPFLWGLKESHQSQGCSTTGPLRTEKTTLAIAQTKMAAGTPVKAGKPTIAVTTTTAKYNPISTNEDGLYANLSSFWLAHIYWEKIRQKCCPSLVGPFWETLKRTLNAPCIVPALFGDWFVGKKRSTCSHTSRPPKNYLDPCIKWIKNYKLKSTD